MGTFIAYVAFLTLGLTSFVFAVKRLLEILTKRGFIGEARESGPHAIADLPGDRVSRN